MKKFSSLLILLLVIGCKSDPIPDPGIATLQAPENNNPCTTAVSINETQGQVTFEWNLATDTDSYEVIVQNQTNGSQQTQTTAITNASLTLEKGFPYSWWVVSGSTASSASAKSAVWQFYLEGNATVTYIPFPATLTAPNDAAVLTDTTVSFQWQGNDLDNDIATYTLFLGTSASNLQERGTTANTQMNVSLSAASTYYWNIRTVDNVGNSSLSQTFSFQIN